jgi:hypothetical protein
LFGVKRQCRFGSLYFGFNVLQVNGAANEKGSKKGDLPEKWMSSFWILNGDWNERGISYQIHLSHVDEESRWFSELCCWKHLRKHSH